MITLRSKPTVALGAGLLLAALLSACGGGSSHTSTATTPTTGGNPSAAGGTGSGSGAGAGSGGGNFPGASGSVAAITGSSMEVQNQQTGQTTVSWTSATTFTKTATLTAASVAAGDCVTVIGSTSTGKLVANTVMVSKPASSGTCTGGRFGAGGRGGGGAFRGGTAPSGGSLPGRPAGSVPSAARGFGFASGKVTSISPSSMVINGISSSGFGAPRTGTRPSTPPTSIKPTPVTIGLQGSTTFTETESTAATSLAVGDCVTAVGSSDTTGAVTARTVRITSTGGQTCNSGFGGFGGGGTAGGGTAGGATAGGGSTNG